MNIKNAAKKFGEAFCEYAETFSNDNPLKSRTHFRNWTIHQQPKMYNLPGAWVFGYTDGNTKRRYYIKILNDLNYRIYWSGFIGCDSDLIEAAKKYASRPKKYVYFFKTTKQIKFNLSMDKIHQGIQFYWDTVIYYKNLGTWGQDVMIKNCQKRFDILDIIWSPGVGLFIEFGKPISNPNLTMLYNTFLMYSGILMVQYCCNGLRLRLSSVSDKILATYLFLSIRSITFAGNNNGPIVYDLPNHVVLEFMNRVRDNPEKQQEFLSMSVSKEPDCGHIFKQWIDRSNLVIIY